jgi:hypothetical protein
VLSIPVAGGTSATPQPSGCDLVKNGKCYHRLVQDAQTFSKYVVPDIACTSECHYINAIQQIYLGYAYGIRPPVPAVDSAHELLFRINSIVTVLYQCVPFSYLQTAPIGPITGPGNGTGAPIGSPPGFGQPSVYLTINHIALGWSASGFFVEPTLGWSQSTTLTNLFTAVAMRLEGEPLDFTYSSVDAIDPLYAQWYPDFPSCDVMADPNSPGVEYGSSAVHLVFEIYQATPEANP